MTTWPVVDRRRVVHAFKPGDSSSSEGPFRTLKKHNWASKGVRVTRRSGRRLGGQMTVFSSLNVDSARLARQGKSDAAMRLARAAAAIEGGPEFGLLRSILSDLPDRDAQSVIDGVLPEGVPDRLPDALKAVARRTEECRTAEMDLPTTTEVVVGRVAEVHPGHVLVVGVGGAATAVPRWMALAVRRDQVGVLLALVLDKLDDGRAIVEATPAIDIDNDVDVVTFSPFGRGDSRLTHLTKADEAILIGDPRPLRILVPVLIEP